MVAIRMLLHSSRRGGRSEVVIYTTRADARACGRAPARPILRAGPSQERPGSKSQGLLIKIL